MTGVTGDVPPAVDKACEHHSQISKLQCVTVIEGLGDVVSAEVARGDRREGRP